MFKAVFIATIVFCMGPAAFAFDLGQHVNCEGKISGKTVRAHLKFYPGVSQQLRDGAQGPIPYTLGSVNSQTETASRLEVTLAGNYRPVEYFYWVNKATRNQFGTKIKSFIGSTQDQQSHFLLDLPATVEGQDAKDFKATLGISEGEGLNWDYTTLVCQTRLL